MAKLATSSFQNPTPYVEEGGVTGERQGCAGFLESSRAREASNPEEQPQMEAPREISLQFSNPA